MTRSSIKSAVTWGLRLGLGGLLIVASIDKLLHPLEFSFAVAGYGVIGQGGALLVAAVLPMLELVTGLLLISGRWSENAALAGAMLYTVFLLLVAQAFVRGIDIECGCYRTEGGGGITWLKVIENSSLAAGAWLLFYLHSVEKERGSRG